MKKTLYLFTFCLILSGCFREDIPVSPYKPSEEVKTATIPLSAYDEKLGAVTPQNQVFFQLSTGQQHIVARESWDLGFETSADGGHIILNSSNYMQVADAGTTDFDRVWTASDMKNYTFVFDSAIGDLNHTAVGDWYNQETGEGKKNVFLIDRGYDGSQEIRGYKKIVFDKLESDTYYFHYAELDGSNPQSVSIEKDAAYNFSFFSLETNSRVQVEPPKTDWDLCFSYYSYRYPDGFPYWLTGALSNRYAVKTAEVNDSTRVFESITLSDTAQFEFTPHIDEIGFDWKQYLFGPPARYVVYSDRIFLVRDTRGYYYKLRFTDFYDDKGERGFPVFEYGEVR
ncbi:MAG: HmuY family protein [Bacteroidia bacterium]|nr:HmuY family protein [Bacteroidia bacterium]